MRSASEVLCSSFQQWTRTELPAVARLPPQLKGYTLLFLEVISAFRHVLTCECLWPPLGHWYICLTGIEIKGSCSRNSSLRERGGKQLFHMAGFAAVAQASRQVWKNHGFLSALLPAALHHPCALQSVIYKGPDSFKGMEVMNEIYSTTPRLLSTINQSSCFFLKLGTFQSTYVHVCMYISVHVCIYTNVCVLHPVYMHILYMCV